MVEITEQYAGKKETQTAKPKSNRSLSMFDAGFYRRAPILHLVQGAKRSH